MTKAKKSTPRRPKKASRARRGELTADGLDRVAGGADLTIQVHNQKGEAVRS
jgi:hypothetical protein